MVDEPICVLAADLDGDGRVDLGTTGGDSDNLAIFHQVAPGAFSPAPDQELGTNATTNRPEALAAADLNGDGRQDLVVANTGANGLSLFLQKTTGTFSALPDAEVKLSSTEKPRSVVAADLDGDGRIDLASANGDGDDLTVFLQNGIQGEIPFFGDEPTQVLGGVDSTQAPQSLAVADLNADGGLDLVSANRDSDLLTVFYQEATGSFSAEPVRLGGDQETMARPAAVACADLNADGRVDVASAYTISSNLAIFYQPPGGAFVDTLLPDVVFGGTPAPSAIAAEDVNGDGLIDIAAGVGGRRLVVFNQPRGGFGSKGMADVEVVVPEPPRSIIAADLNGDGLVDLASGNGRTGGFGGSLGSISVVFQTPSGFPETVDLDLGRSPENIVYAALVAADLNNDGELDLASALQRPVGSDMFLNDRITLFFGGK